MSDFGDRPFVAGSLTGVRSFSVWDGRLASPLYNRTGGWSAGENIAACRSPASNWMREYAGKTQHRAGSMGCHCGFYAYFRPGHNPHHASGNILGLVEGYGLVTVGNRGFRAEKARIVALILTPGILPDDTVWANYPSIPSFRTVDAALAEFPLTVPEGTLEPSGLADLSNLHSKIQAFLAVDTSGFMQQIKALSDAFRNTSVATSKLAEVLKTLAERDADAPPDVRELALRARRDRNHGPDDKRGIDGVRRRG